MAISESTIKNTIHHLFFKTGVRTRSQLVRVMSKNSTVLDPGTAQPARLISCFVAH